MQAYDRSRFEPPAPIAQASVRNPDSGNLVADVVLLIDTGADVSLIPRAAVERAGIQPSDGSVYELEGFDGSRSSAAVAAVDLIFVGRTFRGQFLLTDQEMGNLVGIS